MQRCGATSATRAKGSVLAVESQIAQADSPASAPRKDYQVARFGANPPAGLIELRDKVAADVGVAVRDTARVIGRERERAIGARIVAAVCRDGRRRVSARRIEAQVYSPSWAPRSLIDTSPLGGRDLAGRAGAFARLIKGEGLTVADARQAAGI